MNSNSNNTETIFDDDRVNKIVTQQRMINFVVRRVGRLFDVLVTRITVLFTIYGCG